MFSGLWSGQRSSIACEHKDEQLVAVRTVAWTIMEIGNDDMKSADDGECIRLFGASKEDEEVGYLRGRGKINGGKGIEIEQYSIDRKSRILYNAAVVVKNKKDQNEQDEFWITGDYKKFDFSGKLVDQGVFGFRKEEEDPSVHISKIWEGEAVPDESLQEFCIPTNPIRWCMSILLMQTPVNSNSQIFGAGYFDDSGDIPDQPILHYTLCGSLQPSTTLTLQGTLQKTYEMHPCQVTYTFTLASHHNILHGTWTNTSAGTFGTFSARAIN